MQEIAMLKAIATRTNSDEVIRRLVIMAKQLTKELEDEGIILKCEIRGVPEYVNDMHTTDEPDLILSSELSDDETITTDKLDHYIDLHKPTYILLNENQKHQFDELFPSSGGRYRGVKIMVR